MKPIDPNDVIHNWDSSEIVHHEPTHSFIRAIR